MKTNKKGFTLIELLIVIAIIGILSGVVLTSLNKSRDKALDAKVISTLRNISKGMEIFRSFSGQFHHINQTAGFCSFGFAYGNGTFPYAGDCCSATGCGGVFSPSTMAIGELKQSQNSIVAAIKSIPTKSGTSVPAGTVVAPSVPSTFKASVYGVASPDNWYIIALSPTLPKAYCLDSEGNFKEKTITADGINTSNLATFVNSMKCI